MSKELSLLERLKTIKSTWNCMNPNCSEAQEEDFNIIETALKDYEKLKLKGDEIKDYLYYSHKEFLEDRKKLKALEIIKKKQVDVGALYEFEFDLEWYNKYVKEINGTPTLTQKECDLLKGILL